MDNSEIRRRLLAIAPALHEKYGAAQFWLYGSRVRSEARSDSDIDLLVRFDRRGFSLLDFIGLKQEFEALRGDFKAPVLHEAIAI